MESCIPYFLLTHIIQVFLPNYYKPFQKYHVHHNSLYTPGYLSQY